MGCTPIKNKNKEDKHANQEHSEPKPIPQDPLPNACITNKGAFISQGAGDINKIYTLGKTLGKGTFIHRLIWTSSQRNQ